MRNKWSSVLSWLVFVMLTACSQEDIDGTWTGISIHENGEEMLSSQAERCSFYIDNGAYFFRGNTGIVEKGLISQKNNVLYLRDTLRETDTKQIAYKLIEEDTLELVMNKSSNALLLTMKREK